MKAKKISEYRYLQDVPQEGKQYFVSGCISIQTPEAYREVVSVYLTDCTFEFPLVLTIIGMKNIYTGQIAQEKAFTPDRIYTVLLAQDDTGKKYLVDWEQVICEA